MAGRKKVPVAPEQPVAVEPFTLRWDDIVGHETVKQKLRQMLRAQRLPHAVLLYGPEGVGKRELAEVLAATLLCQQGDDAPCGVCESCRALHGGGHIDLAILRPETAGRSRPVIRIDAVREMESVVSLSPTQAPRRVVLIDGAEAMNESAANSLLKTLEEPPGDAHFILLTNQRSALLDTIISRCMPLGVGALDTGEVVQVLQQHYPAGELDEPAAAELAELADGSPGRAMRLYEHGGLELRDRALKLLQELPQLSMEDIWQRTEELGGQEHEMLDEWLLYLIMLVRDLLVLQSDGASEQVYHGDCRAALLDMLPAYTEPRLYGLYELARDFQRRLATNASARLQLEGFLIRARELFVS